MLHEICAGSEQGTISKSRERRKAFIVILRLFGGRVGPGGNGQGFIRNGTGFIRNEKRITQSRPQI